MKAMPGARMSRSQRSRLPSARLHALANRVNGHDFATHAFHALRLQASIAMADACEVAHTA